MNIRRARFAKSVGLVLLLAVGLIAGTGCKKKAPNEALRQENEKRISDMVSRATGGKADIDFKTGQMKVKMPDGSEAFVTSTGSWPGDLPEEIPVFRGGSLQGSSNTETPTGKNWTILFRLVDPDALASYIKDLETDGWKIVVSSDVENGKFTQLQKERYFIQLTFTEGDKNLAMNVIHQKND